jgi:Sensors of blue-light using FAD
MMQRWPGPSMKDTMQVRVLYVSRAVGPQTTTVTASILSAAQAHNRKNGIGGVLCQGKGLYLQVLEGERSAVNRLYSRIMADSRHRDVEMLCLEEVTKRRYADWSMAHVSLADDHPMVQLKHPEFDPYSASGAFVMTLVDELLASGHRISLPSA